MLLKVNPTLVVNGEQKNDMEVAQLTTMDMI